MAASMPGFLVTIHDYMHQWELPVIAVSGLILVLGWAITLYSDRVDCHHTGCEHGACAPKKDRAHMVLIIASVLFLFNLSIYLFVHRAGIVPGHMEDSHIGQTHEGSDPS